MTRNKTRTLRGVFILCSLLFFACAESASGPSGDPAKTSQTDPAPLEEGQDTLNKLTEAGPIKAAVALSPSQPNFGDQLTLTLEVTAPAGLDVFMPPTGEALGRFVIRSFQEKTYPADAGGTRRVQRYKLEAPSSGPQTIPELLIEFQDRRPNAPTDAIQELLTEEVPFTIASVLPEGALALTLKPPRPALDPLAANAVDAQNKETSRWWWWGAAALSLALIGGFIARSLLQRVTQRSAYELAHEGLEGLKKQGLPDAQTADVWYVQLSTIVRQYLEGRFSLRAPELTTEEFLLAASDSAELDDEHRKLLRPLLKRCDQVKFAAYIPTEAESQEAIDFAWRFVEATRAAEDTDGAQSAPHAEGARS